MFDDFYVKMMDSTNDRPEVAKVRVVVECGLQAALLVILALIGSTVPIFGILAFMCYPAPIVFLCVRYGFKTSFLAGFAAFILISCLLNPFVAIRIFVLSVPIGMIMGYGLKKKWPYFKLICLTTVVAAVLLAVVIYGVAQLIGDFPVDNFVLFPAFGQLAISAEPADNPEVMQKVLWEFLCLGWPMILFVAGLMMTVPALLWNTRLLKKLGADILPPFSEPFQNFRLPVFFSVLGLASIVALFVGIYLQSGPLYQFGFNFSLISSLFGFVSGAALYLWYANRKQWHFGVKLFVFIVIITINIFGEILVLLGLIDPVVNLRSRFS